MNYHKRVLLGVNVLDHIVICDFTNFNRWCNMGSLPYTYLGLPLCIGQHDKTIMHRSAKKTIMHGPAKRTCMLERNTWFMCQITLLKVVFSSPSPNLFTFQLLKVLLFCK